jgi:YfiR/HmsC-like
MELLVMTKRFALAIVCTLALLGGPVSSPGAAQPSEYALKSVFLYNFCRFMEWPDWAFSSPSEPLTIGILGDDPFGPLLQEAIAGEKYHDRPIRVEYYRSVKDIKHCHILFVSRSVAGRTADILAAVAGRNIVTVGETPQFISDGGMIALTAEQNRVRLRINPAELRAANVQVSSKLLRIADTKS